ncbi:hypothetical protein HAX54_030637 [Datura stramonium]|uniref:Uncharacterized protein n=1 Tax=Datura stramonium TaxID=4076 RepID=A0ABS8V981_DATST|nr:hypothetical protein [Datura stramonium]
MDIRAVSFSSVVLRRVILDRISSKVARYSLKFGMLEWSRCPQLNRDERCGLKELRPHIRVAHAAHKDYDICRFGKLGSGEASGSGEGIWGGCVDLGKVLLEAGVSKDGKRSSVER